MTSDRIGLLAALLGVRLCGGCGSSPSLVPQTDTDATAESPSSTAGSATGGTSATVEAYDGGSAGATGGGVATGGLENYDGGSAGATGGGVATGSLESYDAGSAGATGGAAGMGGTPGTGGAASTSSAPDARIGSGTVAMNKTVGASTTSCQQVIHLANPAQSLSGYEQSGPASYLNDSRAGEPSYVYLDGGKDAVILPGPPVSYAASGVDVGAAQLTTCVNAESACSRRDGYHVQVNERLSYLIKIDDWEDEIALAAVELCLDNGRLTTQFVFAGLGMLWGGGVAHDVTITAVLDGVSGVPTTAVTIECRTE